MVFGKVWAMITGTETEVQTPLPQPTEETTALASANSRVANRAKVAKKQTPPQANKLAKRQTPPQVDKPAKKQTPPQVDKPPKKKRAKIPPLSGSQWGALLERCYTHLQADPEHNSIRAFCQEWCPEHERRFYDAWKEAGLQAFVGQRIPVTDPRVRKGIDVVVVKKTEASVKKRKLTTQPPRELPKQMPKKPRIAQKRHGPRGPYQRLLSGREWAEYLEKCYEYHLTATGKPTILAFCKDHCPTRRRTFYTIWNKSGLQEILADRLPLQDVRVQACLQDFIETHDYNMQHNKKHFKNKSNSDGESPAAMAMAAATPAADAAAVAAATTISDWLRQKASAIVEATPIGIAVPVQTEHGDMLSAIKINAEDFILYEDNRLLKIHKDDLLDDYKILGGGGAMHHPALTGSIMNLLNSPLVQQGTSVIYGDAEYLQENNGAYTY